MTIAGIRMKPVQGSTNILAIGYDDEKQILRVAFRRGGCYDHLSVPFELYAEFMQAPSYGVFYATRIKGRFPTASLGMVPLDPVHEDAPSMMKD